MWRFVLVVQLPRLSRVDLIDFDVHMCRGEKKEKW